MDFISTVKYKARRYSKIPRVIKTFRWFVRIMVIIFIMDTGYLVGIWPNWDLYKEGPIQRSNFIREYIFQQYRHRDWPPLRWRTIKFQNIPDHMIRAAIVAEDARFYSHEGFDVEAIKKAIDHNIEKKRFVYGASTISQQTVKNIFLSASRNPLRKWHELLLTFAMERNLGKERILELYLNVAEFGRGVYGIEAAARHYWNKSATRLNKKQAIELAASLSAPVNHNPATRSDYFNKRVKKIRRYF
ncbi:MAG: monofunctional biosynthetic peptidoglycan transglycosylase [Gammaproteobacteria bacterium]|nr:monofunctional biosynthetic peptidoglycan transglycosylase [Gammaproteobacteria bacterium]